MKTVMDSIVEKAKSADMIVIVGAGIRGNELLSYLMEKTISVDFFFDNREELFGKKFHEVEIVKPYKMPVGGVNVCI